MEERLLSGSAHGFCLLSARSLKGLFLKEGEEQKEVLEAADDEEKESEVHILRFASTLNMLLCLLFCIVSLIQSSSVFPRVHFSLVCEFLVVIVHTAKTGLFVLQVLLRCISSVLFMGPFFILDHIHPLEAHSIEQTQRNLPVL